MTAPWLLLGAGALLLMVSGRRRRSARLVVPQRVDEAAAPRWSRWLIRPQYRTARWWEALPRVVYVLPVGAAAALVWTWMRYPAGTVAGVVLVLVLVMLRRMSARQERRHREHVVKPLYAALRVLLGLPEGDAPEKWLRVPQGVSEALEPGGLARSAEVLRLPELAAWLRLPELLARLRVPQARARLAAVRELPARAAARVLRRPEGPAVTVRLPETWLDDPGDRTRLLRLVNSRLPGTWEARWETRRRQPRAVFTLEPQPPSVVTLADLAPEIDRLPANVLVLGRGPRGGLVTLDLDAETPHIAASIGTGGGKSTLLRLMISQVVRREPDARVIVIDPKMISVECLETVPGVTIHVEIEDQWRAIKWYANEVTRRYEVLKEHRGMRFPRLLLVLEEQNMFVANSYRHWRKIKAKKDPARPEVFDDIETGLFMGRAARANELSVFQRMTVRSAGGGELRDQYGAKLLARYSHHAWDSLVGTRPRIAPPVQNGRGIVSIGESNRRCQFGNPTESEALEFALNGRTPVVPTTRLPASVSGAGHGLSVEASLTDVPGQRTDNTGRSGHGEFAAESDENGGPALRVVSDESDADYDDDEPEMIVGLSAAAAHLGMTQANFEKSRQRRAIPGETRIGRQPAWSPEVLDEWRSASRRFAGVEG